MRPTHGRVVDVETLAEFDRQLAAGARTLAGWRVRGVDLADRGDALAGVDAAGALFLGCRLSPGMAHRLSGEGALVMPTIADSPVDIYRSRLYTAEELYDSADHVEPADYADSLDARAYAWSMTDEGAEGELARTLHDLAVDGALRQWVGGRRPVGVMGGHAWHRGEPSYADAARLSHAVTRSGGLVATGGGPGAMEAANLGGWLAPHPVESVDEAVAILATVPSFRPSVGAWAACGWEVRARFPEGAASLAIPTWHYGHEPPNVFATAVAKYFRNAVREAVLLEICTGGIIFLPGAAGTVQEVFQDACENYYADVATTAPMVLVGVDHWTRDLPAWPLLQALARGRAMEPHIHLVDSVEEAAALVTSHRESPAR